MKRKERREHAGKSLAAKSFRWIRAIRKDSQKIPKKSSVFRSSRFLVSMAKLAPLSKREFEDGVSKRLERISGDDGHFIPFLPGKS